ncbi:MAG: hypothetical protein ACM3SQ_15600 [Betaproteobacteria bacterium]
MTTRTRYFVIVSLLVLAVGLGTGLVAYYVGFPTSAFTRQGGPDELQYVPKDAAVLAFADVHDVMTSELRRKLREAAPVPENGQREFQERTGINIETDIDRVVACLDPESAGDNRNGGMVLARGRFDEVRIESLIREHGGREEEYHGKRLLVVTTGHDMGDRSRDTDGSHEMALTFIEPGLIAVGSPSLVRNAVDLQHGGASVTGNTELMKLVRSLDDGNAWAVGRFDALQRSARLPEGVASQLPAITWFSVSSHIDGGIRGVLRAEARDEAAANNLRDVVRGFLALARMQSGSRPELQAVMQSLQLGGTGDTVALSFDLPSDVFDLLRHAAPSGRGDRR